MSLSEDLTAISMANALHMLPPWPDQIEESLSDNESIPLSGASSRHKFNKVEEDEHADFRAKKTTQASHPSNKRGMVDHSDSPTRKKAKYSRVSSRNTYSDDSSANQKLSCPFRKRNPVRFNIRDHKDCASSPFPSMTLLK